MNINKDTVVKPLPDKGLIQEYEEYWRIKLPKDYLDFIRKYNGVEVDNAEFKYGSRVYMIERFLCILQNYQDNPMGMYDIGVVESQIGERLTNNKDLIGVEILPIAVIFAGDFICLDFRKDKMSPSVCVWSHEESSDFDPTLYTIADNFTDFINLLS